MAPKPGLALQMLESLEKVPPNAPVPSLTRWKPDPA